jgi:CDP-paratose synthetase
MGHRNSALKFPKNKITKNILILGGYGFLGQHLVSHLSEKNNIYVGIKSTSKTPDLLLDISFTIFYTDISDFYEHIKKIKFDIIINAIVDYGIKNTENQLRMSNVNLPLKILSSVSLKETMFIHFDSYYSKFPNYFRLPLYQETKRELRDKLSLISDMRILNFQLEHLYGPNDKTEKFIPQMIKCLKKNDENISLTSGIQKRDFLYVDDLLRLISIAINDFSSIPLGYNHFEVGTGSSVMIKSFLKELKTQLNSQSYLNFGEYATHQNEIIDTKADLYKLNKIFLWKPIYDYRLGIKKLLNKI